MEFHEKLQELRKNSGLTQEELAERLYVSRTAISKWESKWNKPFLGSDEKTIDEIIDYIKCMTITQNVNSELYEYLPAQCVKQINDYITAPMTATTFRNDNSRPSREIITSELIYYWMVAFNIPFECQKWHINRLLTLIRICSIKNEPEKKMSRNEVLSRNRALNEARRKAMNSKG